ncbi:MAG: hypothetical protein GXO23_05545 [Crenarchaeota archaeon]|nr:hypothetical protein [Thermoproteota archaeon]
MSSVIEFIKDTAQSTEKIDNKTIKCFEVPRMRFFSKGELLYIGFMLNMSDQEVLNKINEMKLGRKTIEKLYALRLDTDNIWTGPRPVLPSLLENETDLTELTSMGNSTLRVMLHFNGIKDVVCVSLYEYDEYRELVVTKLRGARCVIRYIIYI